MDLYSGSGLFMEVILAKKAGFCFGVERAVNAAFSEADKAKKENKPIYTFGPIIHNQIVVDDLKAHGADMISSVDELDKIPPSRIIIRSHGVGKDVYECITKNGHEIIDTTCPFVSNIHKIAHDTTESGADLIIIGDASHPEVIGIKGWCTKMPFIINDVSDIDELPDFKGDVTVVSQTTFNSKKFNNLVEFLQKK